jgi:hypothetical protein
MKTIKIGRLEIAIKPGDYIIYNGSVYQFCAADGRELKRERFTSYTRLPISKAALSKVPFLEMKKADYDFCGSKIEKWVFVEPEKPCQVYNQGKEYCPGKGYCFDIQEPLPIEDESSLSEKVLDCEINLAFYKAKLDEFRAKNPKGEQDLIIPVDIDEMVAEFRKILEKSLAPKA